jgi:hypothetical protein
VIRNKAAGKPWSFQSIRSIVVMEFKVENTGISDLGIINLNFVGLGKRSPGPGNE